MIVVTGMHRSGTSAVTQLLGELGMDLGDPAQLLVADKWNARGYFENVPVMVCNDRLVLGGGAVYPGRHYYRPRHERTWWMRLRISALWARFLLCPRLTPIEHRARRCEHQMRAMAADFRGKVVKDTRFSLTLAQWRRLDAVERVLVIFRRPEEVARSLARRNGLPQRFGRAQWRLHTHTLLNTLDGLPTVFVDFNRLLHASTCDAELDRVIAFAGGQPDPQVRERLKTQCIRPDLATTGRDDMQPDASLHLYRQLQQCHARYATPQPFEPMDTATTSPPTHHTAHQQSPTSRRRMDR